MSTTVQTVPLHPIRTSALLSLAGINDQIEADEYSLTADIDLGKEVSGEILGFMLYSTGGAILTPLHDIIFLDADPNTAAGDTALTAAEHKTVIATVNTLAGQWRADANGGVVFRGGGSIPFPIPFHALDTIYAVFKLGTAMTAINSAGGDDEEFDIRVWWRRDS